MSGKFAISAISDRKSPASRAHVKHPSSPRDNYIIKNPVSSVDTGFFYAIRKSHLFSGHYFTTFSAKVLLTTSAYGAFCFSSPASDITVCNFSNDSSLIPEYLHHASIFLYRSATFSKTAISVSGKEGAIACAISIAVWSLPRAGLYIKPL